MGWKGRAKDNPNSQSRTVFYYYQEDFPSLYITWVSSQRPGSGPTCPMCFTCLTPYHDMNNCGPCLTSPPHTQQCCAIRLFLRNMEPRSVPLPVLSVDKGITRLALQLGSVDLACWWLANWNLAYLEHRALCLPVSTTSLSCTSYLVVSLAQSGSQPQVTGSPQVVSRQSPRSALPTFEEAVKSTGHQTSSASITSSVQEMSAGSQPPLVSTFSTPPECLHSIQSLTSLAIVVSVEDADLAMLDHKSLIANFPSDGSELLAISGHHEEVVTSQNPAETQTFIPLSWGCTVLPGNNSVSLDHGVTSQMWVVAPSTVNQTFFSTTTSVGSFLRPPPLLLISGLSGMGPSFLWLHSPSLVSLGSLVGVFPRFFFFLLFVCLFVCFYFFCNPHRFIWWDQIETSHP